MASAAKSGTLFIPSTNYWVRVVRESENRETPASFTSSTLLIPRTVSSVRDSERLCAMRRVEPSPLMIEKKGKE